MRGSWEAGPERVQLKFDEAVSERFAFLARFGYVMEEALPTLVRYRKGGLEARIYHGRMSYEIGFELIRQGTRYSLEALVRASDAQAAEAYRPYAATTPEGVADGLERLAGLVRRHAERALRDDAAFFAAAVALSEAAAAAYALEVLAGQVRPKAHAAFRNGSYGEAVALLEKIRPVLSPAEQRMLEIATKRAAGS